MRHPSPRHQIATHDFALLGALAEELGPEALARVQVAFFWFARHHVLLRLRTFPHALPRAAFYFPIGRVLSWTHLRHVDLGRLAARLGNGALARLALLVLEGRGGGAEEGGGGGALSG